MIPFFLIIVRRRTLMLGSSVFVRWMNCVEVYILLYFFVGKFLLRMDPLSSSSSPIALQSRNVRTRVPSVE